MEKQNKTDCQEQLIKLKKEYDEFAYIVSHDLKAPVRAISNLSTWIEEDLGENTPQEVQQNLNLLRNRASRLELMIEALLKYSRVSTHQFALEATDIRDLINTALESTIDIKQITIEVPAALPVFISYKEKLRFVFEQILKNTAFFGKSEKLTVVFSLTEVNDFYKMEFADNGGGVSDEILTKLFNLFYTGAPKDTVNTTGAGLTISKKIVQTVGGEMWASHNVLGGLSINFTWPKEIII